MIPMLVLYLIRKFKRKPNLLERLKNLKRLAVSLIIAFFLLVLTSAFADYKANVLTYNVVKNNNIIGVIKMSETISGKTIAYNLNSNIQAKFVLKFNVIGKEQSIYKNDTLVFSSVYRKINNKVKVDHNIQYREGYYDLNRNNNQHTLPYKVIKQNLIMLYYKEPKNINRVYCDNLNEMVSIKRLSQGVYRVNFSNGKHNTFYYKNGKCIKVEAVSSLFNVTLIPA